MRRKITFLIIFIVFISFVGCKKSNPTEAEIDISTQPIKNPGWIENSITQPVPSWGSQTRLVLPAQIEQIVMGNAAGIGGFGSHQGGHIEGLDHVWLEIQTGIPVRSWSSGIVTKIENMGSELFITIQFEGGLTGKHMEVASSLVSVGQHINAGDPVCYGISNGSWQSAEFMLNDANRNDGELAGAIGSYVSPFDYLKDDIKQELENSYFNKVIEPFLLKGLDSGNNKRIEPYLTNRVLFHKLFKNTPAGEWLLDSHWGPGGYPDILILFDVNNNYFKGKKIIAADDSGEGQYILDGNWSADSLNHHIIFSSGSLIYYGLYQIDESTGRAKLKIEYNTSSFPVNFSPSAAVYIERTNLPRRVDASDLGVY